jgi:hypothetical protein
VEEFRSGGVQELAGLVVDVFQKCPHFLAPIILKAKHIDAEQSES